MNAIADVLHTVRCVAGNDLARLLVIEAERGDPAVLAMEDARLAVGRRRRQPAEPAADRVAFLAQQARDRRHVAQLHRATQVRMRERVDLEHDEPAPFVARTALATERAELHVVVPAQQRTRALPAAPLHHRSARPVRRVRRFGSLSHRAIPGSRSPVTAYPRYYARPRREFRASLHRLAHLLQERAGRDWLEQHLVTSR